MIKLLRSIRYIGPMAQIAIYFFQIMGILAFSLMLSYALGFSPIEWLFDVLVDLAEALVDAVLL